MFLPPPGLCVSAAYLVGALWQVGHGGGQTALRGQEAGVLSELVGQDRALHRYLAVPQELDGLAQDHHLLHKILSIKGTNKSRC